MKIKNYRTKYEKGDIVETAENKYLLIEGKDRSTLSMLNLDSFVLLEDSLDLCNTTMIFKNHYKNYKIKFKAIQSIWMNFLGSKCDDYDTTDIELGGAFKTDYGKYIIIKKENGKFSIIDMNDHCYFIPNGFEYDNLNDYKHIMNTYIKPNDLILEIH